MALCMGMIMATATNTRRVMAEKKGIVTGNETQTEVEIETNTETETGTETET